MVLSIFLLSLSMTFNNSLDTLVSQAYGQKDLRLCKVYLNRQLYLTTIVFGIISIPLIFAKTVMIAFGIEPAIALTASSYVWICIPGVLCYSWQTCLNKYFAG